MILNELVCTEECGEMFVFILCFRVIRCSVHLLFLMLHPAVQPLFLARVDTQFSLRACNEDRDK